jgi:hypothetical protein
MGTKSSFLYRDEPKLHYCTTELEVLMGQGHAHPSLCGPVLSLAMRNDEDLQLLWNFLGKYLRTHNFTK